MKRCKNGTHEQDARGLDGMLRRVTIESAFTLCGALCLLIALGCQSLDVATREEVTGQWSHAHGGLGEFDTLTLQPDGSFMWVHVDEPLRAHDTYKGTWKVRGKEVHLLVLEGTAVPSHRAGGVHKEIVLERVSEAGKDFLIGAGGFRLEKTE